MVRKGLLLCLLAVSVGLPARAALASGPPVNDSFANAIQVGLPFSDARDTTGATIEPGEPRPCGEIGATVWYRFTPARAGFVGIGAGNFPTVAAVYTGATLGSLVNLGCGVSEAYTVLVGFEVQAGVNYYLQVGGLNSSEGNVLIRVFWGGAISGTVADESGAPLSGICVSAEDPGAGERAGTSTGSSGAYRILGLPHGSYYVSFRDCNDPARYASESYNDKPIGSTADPVAVDVDQETPNVNAMLTLGGSISGRVTDEASNPLQGICIEVYGDAWGSGRTDAFGGYVVGALPTGSYTVTFHDCNEPARYLSEAYNDRRDPEAPDPVAVVQGQETLEIDASLALGGSISGRVTNEAGEPLEGICVGVTGQDSVEGSTSQSGSYVIGLLRSGDYSVRFSDCIGGRYVDEFYDDKGDRNSANVVPVVQGNETHNIDASLALGGSISGTVTGATGALQPVVCVQVFTANGNPTGSPLLWATDRTGAYRVGGLRTGRYKLRFDECETQQGYLSEYYNDRADEVSADLIDVTLGQETSGIDASLALGGSISGTVTDETGVPLGEVCVSAMSPAGDTARSVWSEVSGVYEILGLRTGTYEVLFSDCGRRGYLSEYYDDKPDAASADPISVSQGERVPGIDASLARPQGAVRIVESDGSTQVPEGAAPDSYQVVLTSEPTADVRVAVNADPQLSASPSTLVFDSSNWNTPQTVSVSAVDDYRAQGSRTASIGHESQSADPAYSGIAVAGVEVAIVDNDAAGIVVTESDGSTQVTEGGAPDTYSIALTSEPTNPVTITLNSDVQLSASPTTLVFEASNWSTPQSVTIAAVDDYRAQGPRAASITHVAASDDPGYDRIPIPAVTAAIADNDAAGIQVAESDGSTSVTEGGAPDTYQVSLASEPTNPVTITLNPDPQLQVSPTTLVFDSSNWNLPQTVTVRAVDDCRMQGDRTATVSHVISSADQQYEGLQARTVSVKILDDDSPRWRVLKRSLCRLDGLLPAG